MIYSLIPISNNYATNIFLLFDLGIVCSKYDGIFYPAKGAGDYVSKGMKIGQITNYFDEAVETVYASEDGILLIIMNTPPINKGETIAVIGKVN
ncbi:MAG: hypothetical protein AAFZ15_00500 [Bacteroidota bacterium]